MEKPFWDHYSSPEAAEKAWDEGATTLQKSHPLKVLKTLPQMPGIADDTKKFLTWKSLKWMFVKDEEWRITKHILKRPFVHGFRYLKSLFKRKSYVREGDFYYYGISSSDEMKTLMQDKDALLVVGFSYCEKPHECPSGRFTPDCIRKSDHPVCRQCFIGKSAHMLPENDRNTVFLLIPTIHYIGRKMFEVIEANPTKKVLFIITACEMTLEMFGDFGNLAGARGIGVRLDGRICNTMKAFELSEQGIKPGLTLVLPETERRIIDLLAVWRNLN